MSSLSKEALFGEKSYLMVKAGDAEHRARLLLALEKRYGPEGAEAADVLLDMAGADAARMLEKMLFTDREDTRQDADVHGPRDEQHKLAGRVSNGLVILRGIADRAGGRRATDALGFDGRTPRGAQAIHQLAVGVVETIGRQGVPAAVAEAGVDVSGLVEQLRTDTAALGEARTRLAKELREAETSQLAKVEAADEFDEAFDAYAGILARLLDRAGMHAEADRLRPSQRRSGRTEDTADQEDAAGDDAVEPGGDDGRAPTDGAEPGADQDVG